jgi:uncharacterized protein with HEPN domain
MTVSKDDKEYLQQILSWCAQVEETHAQFNRSLETFNNTSVYRNALSMCLLQIGEEANHLSEEFKKAHTELPWNKITGMSNRFAHVYGTMDTDIIWDTATYDVPEIERFCRKQIDSNI